MRCAVAQPLLANSHDLVAVQCGIFCTGKRGQNAPHDSIYMRAPQPKQGCYALAFASRRTALTKSSLRDAGATSKLTTSHNFLRLTAKLHPVYYDAPLLKTFAALYLNVSIYEMKISFAAPRQRLTWGDQWNVPHTNRTITWLKISRSILCAPA